MRFGALVFSHAVSYDLAGLYMDVQWRLLYRQTWVLGALCADDASAGLGAGLDLPDRQTALLQRLQNSFIGQPFSGAHRPPPRAPPRDKIAAYRVWILGVGNPLMGALLAIAGKAPTL
jgi:hypothetical protein